MKLARKVSKDSFRHLVSYESSDTFSGIFDTAGNEKSAEPQECIGLERASVWEEVGVEERLLDTFMGRPNATAERHKVRLK